MMKHRLHRLSLTAILAAWIVAGCGSRIIQQSPTPMEQLEQKFQKAKVYDQSGQWDALITLMGEATLLIADDPELSDQEYRVCYFKARGFMGKKDFQSAFEASDRAVALASIMNRAGKLTEDTRRQVAQVFLDSLMLGVEMGFNQEEFQTALELIDILKETSEKLQMYPSDFSPVFHASHVFYAAAQRLYVSVEVPDSETKQRVLNLVDAGDTLFSWASKHGNAAAHASVECLRLQLYWSIKFYYYEVCSDPLLISPQATTQVTSKDLVTQPELIGKSMIYLDATQVQVVSQTQLSHAHSALIQTNFGPFYLRCRERLNLPAAIFARFTNIVELRDGNVVKNVPELEVLTLKVNATPQ